MRNGLLLRMCVMAFQIAVYEGVLAVGEGGGSTRIMKGYEHRVSRVGDFEFSRRWEAGTVLMNYGLQVVEPQRRCIQFCLGDNDKIM